MSTTTNLGSSPANNNTRLVSNPYKFSAYRNSALSVTTGSYQKIPFDTKEFDTGGNFDIVTNIGRFTAPIAGFYHINFLVGVGISDTDDVATLYKNGSIYKWGNEAKGGGSVLSTLVQLAANDYLEVYVSTSVTVINVGSAPQKTWFSGFLVSAT